MNIFAVDPCPVRSAQALDDVRVNKMIIESMQMMAFAMAANDVPENLLPLNKEGNTYKVHGPHKKHPCSIWAGQTRGNFMWLLNHTTALVEEFRLRGGKGHDNMPENLRRAGQAVKYFKDAPRQEFANCSLWKGMGDVHFAYRLTMVNKWEKEKLNATTSTLYKIVEKIMDPYMFEPGQVRSYPKVRRSSPPKWTNRNPPGFYEFFVKNNFGYKTVGIK